MDRKPATLAGVQQNVQQEPQDLRGVIAELADYTWRITPARRLWWHGFRWEVAHKGDRIAKGFLVDRYFCRVDINAAIKRHHRKLQQVRAGVEEGVGNYPRPQDA